MPKPKSDFVVLTRDDLVYKAVCLVHGPPGCGKTTFACRYAPEPIAVINLDCRAKGVIVNIMEEWGLDIRYVHIDYPRDVFAFNPSDKPDKAEKEMLLRNQSAAIPPVDKVLRNYYWALNEPYEAISTVVIDTVTEFSDLMYIRARGAMDLAKGDFGRSKGLVNRQLQTMVEAAKAAEKHVIFLSRSREIWRANEPTGEFIPRCPDAVVENVDWHGYLKAVGSNTGNTKWRLKMTKAGANGDELGKVYKSEQWEKGDVGPFAWACALQYHKDLAMVGEWA